MDSACDIDKPIGYWVKQIRSGVETIAVKVLYTPSVGQVDIRVIDPKKFRIIV